MNTAHSNGGAPYRPTAMVILLPGAAASPVVQPERRGRYPAGVVPRYKLDRARRRRQEHPAYVQRVSERVARARLAVLECLGRLEISQRWLSLAEDEHANAMRQKDELQRSARNSCGESVHAMARASLAAPSEGGSR